MWQFIRYVSMPDQMQNVESLLQGISLMSKRIHGNEIIKISSAQHFLSFNNDV